ncbi:hypothetical protein PFAG_00432 [Plasmodium falciparum Santa Lucia]|uniref:Uncharacterized protein n=1 Tax=Plasmodium falciparum Santa Lucia TaxID=478859 RepID=W7GC52_PLAFA|nr:hypothetical protein PFAG_00432 [Plasmodium falciparum Santa Lucia]
MIIVSYIYENHFLIVEANCGRFIAFARQSRFLRAATLSKCLRRNFWGSDFYYDGKPKSKENPQQIFKNSQDEVHT